MQLCLDIGGTKIRVALSSDGQSLTTTKIIPTANNYNQDLTSIKQVVNELRNGQKINKVVCGIAGPLNKEKTHLVKSPHLSGWINKPFKKDLETIFNAYVHLENDTVLGGLGEANLGAGKDHKIVAYIAIGTGVGGSRIVDRKLDSNSLGFEPGHQIIIPDGNDCACGGKGHLESYIGGQYLEKYYQKRAEDIKDEKVWDQVTKYLSIGLTNTIVHWSPDIVILGGSVSQSIPLDTVKNYLRQYLTIFPQSPIIKKASLGDNAGLYGALVLV